MKKYDAVVVGSGPNGLAAAVALARAGRSVLVREASEIVGGGARTEALTLPGFQHDTFSACHPLGVASPFFRALKLERHGLEWLEGEAQVAHPFDDAPTALLRRSVDETAAGLGGDAENYRRLMAPLARRGEELLGEIFHPLARIPRHPFLMARFGLSALTSVSHLAHTRFRGPRARALFAGIAAHSTTPLTWPGSSAVGLVLGLAGHVFGWPIPRGGAGQIASALVAEFESLGGVIERGSPVAAVDQLPEFRTLFFDLTPRQILRVAKGRLPSGYARTLERFRYGPGVFKMDWALAGPIPWKDPTTALSSTVHLGGSIEEQLVSEAAPMSGQAPPCPYVLLVQPSLIDPSRAPAGKHTAWAYCHIPNGSTENITARIEAQIERFAPGFRNLILAKHSLSPAQLEARNANLVGGDIGGGLSNLPQLLMRPTLFSPYRMPVPGWYLCSASTPPGPGVHGMSGYNAAMLALNRELKN